MRIVHGTWTRFGTTNYLYDGRNVLEELDSTGNMLARYTQGGDLDEPLSELRSGATDYYEQDGLGSITSLSNGAGALDNTYVYDSFGSLTASSGTIANPFRYTGREFDAESGLQFSRARYYDVKAGRFLSEDPIGFLGGQDFYAYVGNSATNRIDPSGLSWWGNNPTPPPPPSLKPPPIFYPGGGDWNGSGVNTNNCYSYACDRLHPPGANHAPQPGEDEGLAPGLNCLSLKIAAEADGVLDSASGDCPCNYHRVKLYSGQNTHNPAFPYDGHGIPDYHWYRQDAYGGWSSKHGLSPVGPQEDNPDIDALSWGYDQRCGTMCAPNQ